MKLSRNGRLLLACAVSIALMLGVTSCGGGTIGYLWVLGGQSASNTVGNVITGYKIDDYTGNLTEIVGSPFTAGAGGTTSGTTTAPVYGAVLSGGRYLYTLNKNSAASSVVEFSVGGDGVLSAQQTYGSIGGTPVWMDLSGGYLYVLDQVSPARNAAGTAPACASSTKANNTAPCGSVEVFAITTDTGQLTPVLNTSIKVNNVAINYFPVGPAPTRMKVVGTSLVVLNGDGTVTSLGIGSAGQLTTSANSLQVIDSTALITFTSITTGGSYVYLTDGSNNRIFQYTLSNGVLQPVSGSPYSNIVASTTPMWTVSATDGTNQFLYVLNSGSTTATQGSGSISLYSVASANGHLDALPGQNSQTTTGASPMCAVVDSSLRYLYTANADGTVTGFLRTKGVGSLAPLVRGSTFNASGIPTCLVTSNITS